MNLFFWRKKKNRRDGGGGKRAAGEKRGGGLDLDAMGVSADDPEWETKLRSALAARGHKNPDKAVERVRERFARKA